MDDVPVRDFDVGIVLGDLLGAAGGIQNDGLAGAVEGVM